jgi:S1-C subfamily serine protease
MRDNESDGAGGWWQPPEQDAETRRPGPGANSPSDSDYPDTIAFGTPPGSPSRGNQGGPGNRGGYGNQGYYGNQDGYPGQGGYGNQPGGYGNQGGYGDPGGGAGPGWAMPDPPPGRRSPRGGRLLVYVAVAALAAGVGAGATVAFGGHSTPPAAGVSSGDVPGPHDNASGSGASAAPLNPDAVRKKVDPGLVDIMSNLKFNGETAEGTGMVISASGLVLTNNHVIDGATSVRANLATNSSPSFTAKVVGYDAADDVALLQLQGASGLTPVTFGNSSQVRLGTPVLALGNAEGHGGAKPTQGIINALDRSIQASDEGSNSTENLKHMLQTNAKIEQGDSGGALANNAGQVIGMITAANTSTPGTSSSSGSGGSLGFAIPINSALAIARQIASGQPSATVHIGLPGFLGVEVAQSDSSDPQQQAADEAQAGRTGAGINACSTGGQRAGVPVRVAPIAAGALIVGVVCDSAAQTAGMVPGDVITSVNGQPVTTPGSLTIITGKYHPNEVVSVLWVNRNGIERTTKMLLGEGPAR